MKEERKKGKKEKERKKGRNEGKRTGKPKEESRRRMTTQSTLRDWIVYSIV